MKTNVNKNLVIEANADLPGRSYADDKPWSCKYCYWWHGKTRGCGLKQCHYLISEQKKEQKKQVSGQCEGCPYGKHVPCIGYCIASLYSEMKAGKGSG